MLYPISSRLIPPDHSLPSVPRAAPERLLPPGRYSCLWSTFQGRASIRGFSDSTSPHTIAQLDHSRCPSLSLPLHRQWVSQTPFAQFWRGSISCDTSERVPLPTVVFSAIPSWRVAGAPLLHPLIRLIVVLYRPDMKVFLQWRQIYRPSPSYGSALI